MRCWLMPRMTRLPTMSEFSRVETEPIPTPVTPLKLALVSPTYGPIDPLHAKCLRVAVMNASARGHQWLADVSPDRMLIEGARNAAVDAALQLPDLDGIVWVDSDMIIDPNAISRLLSYGKDFVSGVYFQRIAPYWPLVTLHNPDINRFQFVVKWPDNSVFPADGVGFGFCYTSLAMIRRIIEESPDVKERGLFHLMKCGDGSATFSEDFSFCRRANLLGYKVYVDTGLKLGHQGDPQVITYEDFKRVNPYQNGAAEPVTVGVNR